MCKIYSLTPHHNTIYMDLEELNSLDKPQYLDKQENDNCPSCDGYLVKRYQRTYMGKEFLGCSNYPKCEFTQDI